VTDADEDRLQQPGVLLLSLIELGLEMGQALRRLLDLDFTVFGGTGHDEPLQ
jgi:hypothetical protein